MFRFCCLLWPLVLSAVQALSQGAAVVHTGIYCRGTDTLYVGHYPDHYFLFGVKSGQYTDLDNSLRSRDKAVEAHFEGDQLLLQYKAERLAFKQVPAYSTQDFVIPNGDIRLAGMLWKPRGATVSPLVILVSGSAEATREDMGALPYWFVAHGYAVVTYDKRGAGATNGHYESWFTGLAPLASDVICIADSMARLPFIDPRNVSLLGISNGGWVITIAASERPMFRRIVPQVGGFIRVRDQELYRMRNLALAGQAAAPALVEMNGALRAVFSDRLLKELPDTAALRTLDSLKQAMTGRSWLQYTSLSDKLQIPSPQLLELGRASWRNELSYDPEADMQRVHCPVYGILGETDVTNDTWSIVDIVARHKQADQWPQVQLFVIPGVPHAMRTAGGQVPEAYWKALETIFLNR